MDVDGGGPAELLVDPLPVLRRRRSAKWRSHPTDVLPLTLAEMDYPLAPPVAAALHQAVDRSDAGYPVTTPELGQAWAAFAGNRWSWTVQPTAVTAVADVGVGIVELLRVLTRPGQVVLLSPPVYPPFYDWVREAGAQPREVPLRRGADGWSLDLPALERAFADRPAAYLLCNPHNPVGRVHTAAELETLVALASRYNVILVSDEIHAPLVLPGATFTPLLSVPGAGEVAVTLVAASKAWNLAGLKCAAIITASPTMATAVQQLPADTPWRVGHLGVLATVAALTAGEPWLEQLLCTLDRRRTQFGSLLTARLPAIAWHPPQATYLAWLDCTALDCTALDGGSGDAREVFLRRGRVALDPGVTFGTGGQGHARLNFATSADILDQATAAMAAATA